VIKLKHLQGRGPISELNKKKRGGEIYKIMVERKSPGWGKTMDRGELNQIADSAGSRGPGWR